MLNWFERLNEFEKEIIFCLTVLPQKHYSFPELSDLFSMEENEKSGFFDIIHDLSTTGILDRDKASYALKPSNSQQVLDTYHPGTEECSRIINYFLDKLELSDLDYEQAFLPAYHSIRFILERIENRSIHLAQLSYLLSSNLVKFNKLDEALKYNQIAVEISEEIDKSHPIVALFYRDKAFIHKKLGDAQKAIYYSLKDIEILERYAGKYDDLLPDSYFALSKTYEAVQNYQKAVEYNLKAIKYEKKRSKKKSLSLSNLYHNLAFYYMKLNNLHHANMFINKAVEMFSRDKSKESSQYLQLIKDQKKFNSLYEIELIIRKLKYPILIFLFLLTGGLLVSLYNLIF